MSILEFPTDLPAPTRPTPRSDTLQSVSTALDVLDCFLSTPELGVSEIARRLGIAKSSAHRLLTTLAARNIVEKNPETGQYRLGVHLFALGHLAQPRVSLSSLALPELQRLHGATGQSVFVGLMDGDDAVYPHYVGSAAVSVQINRESVRRRSYATALGRAMAAVDPVLQRRLRAHAAAGRGPDAVRAVADFDRAIEAFRRTGVAVSRDGVIPGLSAVAAPVKTLAGKPVGALVVAGPTATVVPGTDRIARLLPPAAARVSRLVGAG